MHADRGGSPFTNPATSAMELVRHAKAAEGRGKTVNIPQKTTNESAHRRRPNALFPPDNPAGSL